MKAYTYILLCSNDKYYTGSTRDLEKRLEQHSNGEGANFTRKNLPVKLVYFEEFDRIDEAFYREKQIQGWSHGKKEALISGDTNKLHQLAECKNSSRTVVPASLASTPLGKRSTLTERNQPGNRQPLTERNQPGNRQPLTERSQPGKRSTLTERSRSERSRSERSRSERSQDENDRTEHNNEDQPRIKS